MTVHLFPSCLVLYLPPHHVYYASPLSSSTLTVMLLPATRAVALPTWPLCLALELHQPLIVFSPRYLHTALAIDGQTGQATRQTVCVDSMASFGKEARIVTLLIIDVVFFLVEIIAGEWRSVWI